MDMTPSVNGNVCVGLIAHRHIRGCLRQSSQRNRETPSRGTRQHKIHYQRVKAAAHLSMFQPLRRLTDAFAFHVDQRQAAGPGRACTHSKCSTLKSGGISAPKPKAGNILSLGKRKRSMTFTEKAKYQGQSFGIVTVEIFEEGFPMCVCARKSSERLA